ncbi:MAG: hypothetical protein DWQ47_07480 [Acidobacteria bacterium]|nr:MAG: hypothetical protein DWQ32_15580 [Acidobacteriota bacterium]REJ99235.1 MAG: hypothetical protein DWQ38_14395 [Acidobacteriota bacterium]REK16044.1 MAG: hypothetical protein DWQ43_03290 [Acidobacteriota bacterium]REK43725.1 MAG: hypothetical protein DWQ47_07480 [Acidobacteriota bacterium]
MKTFKILLLILCLTAFAGFLPAQEPGDKKALADAESFVKEAREYIEKQGEPHLVIADLADHKESSKPVWTRFETQEAFENTEGEDIYTIALIWTKDERVLAVNFTYTSPSGDWAHYVDHIFHPSGYAVQIRKELRTFNGDMIVVRNVLFDSYAKELKSTKEYFDLNTQKPVKATDNFQDVDVDVYIRASDLPFFDLLKVSGKQ